MKFSIIIPIFNVESYISECIYSVISQEISFKEFEIILVDDGSTDKSAEIAKEFANNNPNVKYFYKKNGGLSSARNYGLTKASGDYIIFLDSDDFWLGKNNLQLIAEVIEKKRPDIILYGFTSYFSGRKPKTDPFVNFNREIITGDFNRDFSYLIKKHIYRPTACDKVISKKIIMENEVFFPEGLLHEDVAWCFDIALYLNTYELYPCNFYQYRENRPGSLTFVFKDKNISDLIFIILEKFTILNYGTNNQEPQFVNALFNYLSRNFVIVLHHLTKSNIKSIILHMDGMKTLSPLLNYYTYMKSRRNSMILIFVCKCLGVDLGVKLIFYLRQMFRL